MLWPPLKSFQKEALDCLKNPGHLICVSPTGSGKSRIFESFARDFARRTLIATPLIALARQQADKLNALGIETFLSAGNPTPKKQASEELTRSKVWIASPEQLSRSFYRELFSRWGADFFVVDECHCLWDWGRDFRPSFLQLPELAHQVERSLWLTATLPLDARADLRRRLPKPLTELGRFDLPANLYLEIHHRPWTERADFLFEWIMRRKGQPGVIFVSTRQSTERISRLLSGFGKKATSYHAGLSFEERRLVEKKVAQQEIEILVSTSAFGMGMDHQHLKWVLLWQPPGSVLQLTQSLGRVGRDSTSPSYAAVLWSGEDFARDHDGVARTEIKNFLQAPGCRTKTLRNYYNQDTPVTIPAASLECGRCDFCL